MSHSRPDPSAGTVVVPAPGAGAGNWAGAAGAVRHDGAVWMAYRVRRPLDAGRGVSVVVARSEDGVAFEPVCEVFRETFGAASFERPAIIALPDGGWRLYLSCATPESKHWWVEALDADRVEDLPGGRRSVVLPGDDTLAVKDPVVLLDDDGWHLWLCCHPLTEPGHEDRMTTRYLSSADGLAWRDEGEVLAGTPGSWDARGARVSAVLGRAPLTVLYDGRATAEQNWFERTGIARSEDGLHLVADPSGPVLESAEGDHAFRYAVVLPHDDGAARWYAEVARADGSQDLMTWLVPRPGH
ncbi:hypothetical protein [Phycicoccus avicenniae]|uniref:hypothetical protein n=1 Tax=Phycicoccus avicenniae TaxID=2828860 RepID=UPI003D26A689